MNGKSISPMLGMLNVDSEQNRDGETQHCD